MGIMCPILSGSSATTQTPLQCTPPTPFSSSAQRCRRYQISLANLVIKTVPPHTPSLRLESGAVFLGLGGDGARVGARGEGMR